MIVRSTLCLRCATTKSLNDGQREWHIADIPGLLREERYDELDERYNRAPTESLPAAKRKSAISSPSNQMDNPFTIWTRWLEAGPRD